MNSKVLVQTPILNKNVNEIFKLRCVVPASTSDSTNLRARQSIFFSDEALSVLRLEKSFPYNL